MAKASSKSVFELFEVVGAAEIRNSKRKQEKDLEYKAQIKTRGKCNMMETMPCTLIQSYLMCY